MNARGNCPGILIGNYYYFIFHKVQKNVVKKIFIIMFIYCLFTKILMLLSIVNILNLKIKVEFCLEMIYDKIIIIFYFLIVVLIIYLIYHIKF